MARPAGPLTTSDAASAPRTVLRRIAPVVVLVACVIGGALAGFLFIRSVEPVSLLTDPGGPGYGACYLSFIEGDLVTDPTAGTAINGHPVMWPAGWTGRRSGSEVEILDRTGKVVLRTGTRVHLGGGFVGGTPTVWLACGALNLPRTLP